MAEATRSGLGSVSADGDRRRVHFERVYAASPEEVWAALTEPERLARWLTDSTVEPRAGGQVVHDFGPDDGTCGGTILVWEPPRALEYEWRFPQEPESVVRFELTPRDDGGTLLVLDHRRLGTAQASGYGAGWHAHLDGLGAHVDDLEPVDWDERFSELLPDYQP